MRRRRTASRIQLNALRVLGWRYSTTREAWVHRVGRGRYGPVFRLESPPLEPGAATVDHELSEAIVKAKRHHHHWRTLRHDRRMPSTEQALAAQLGPVSFGTLTPRVHEPEVGAQPYPVASAPAARQPYAPTQAPPHSHAAAQAMAQQLMAPTNGSVEAPAPPLPQRVASTPRPVTPVEVQLHDEEPPRVVLVDGRPPALSVPRPTPGGPALYAVRSATA